MKYLWIFLTLLNAVFLVANAHDHRWGLMALSGAAMLCGGYSWGRSM